MEQILVGVLEQYSWLVYVYLAGWIGSLVLRAGWPDEADRPRAVRMLLALCDAANLSFPLAAKTIGRKLQK